MPAIIKKIVLTGGPCAGKTTGLSWIRNAFSQRGWTVLIVPETATELISGGVAPWTCGTNLDYQLGQVRLQLTKEDIFLTAARTMPVEKILIVCDRGVMDNRAYMNEEEFAVVADRLGLSVGAVLESYDAVLHLQTAAKGAEEAYSLANNQARYETAEEARALDDRIIAAWTGHPHMRVIGNETDFDTKMRRLISEIGGLLGEGKTYEMERKFLIAMPDTAWLEAQPGCHRVEIIQTYLHTEGGVQRRVRQWLENGRFFYYETVKTPMGDGRLVETERRLTQEEYLTRLMNADTSRRPLRKTRFIWTWEGQRYDIDLYPFWERQAILKMELREKDAPIAFPPTVRVLREITGEAAYRNSALALNVPAEEDDRAPEEIVADEGLPSAVRAAAVARIHSYALLTELALHGATGEIRRAARARAEELEERNPD